MLNTFTKNEKTFPDELKKFNWGAFLLSWIWAIGNKAWFALVPVIIPMFLGRLYILCSILTFISLVWVGIMGNRWAWNAKNWENIEEFNRVQKLWAGAGAFLMIAILAITIGIVISLI